MEEDRDRSEHTETVGTNQSVDRAKGPSLSDIIVPKLISVMKGYRSIETYTLLYDTLAGTVEIRLKLSVSPVTSQNNK